MTLEEVNAWRVANGYEPVTELPAEVQSRRSNDPWRKPDQGGDAFWNFHNGH